MSAWIGSIRARISTISVDVGVGWIGASWRDGNSLENLFSPIFCVSRWGLHQYLTMHIWIGVVGIVTLKTRQEEIL